FYRFHNDWPIEKSERRRTRVRIRFSYKILDGTVVEEFAEWVLVKDESELYVRPAMPIDFESRGIGPKLN
ncbi:hypothetical protein, partial [Rhodovulum sulfidophilum]|uniref:hypothetical protein n=1 Tax=Rhodovulum sulfidophilum TaxID=35806 RepID=UPI001F32294A